MPTRFPHARRVADAVGTLLLLTGILTAAALDFAWLAAPLVRP